MSLENLKEYARRCATEPELRARAKEIGVTDLDEHMRHSEDLGLGWSMEDMVALRDEMTDADGEIGELGEEDLEQIAGGAVSATAAVVGVAAGVGAAAGVTTAVALAGSGW